MDDLNALKEEFKKFQNVDPRFRRYPKSLWAKVVELSEHYPLKKLARELGIESSNIKRWVNNKKRQVVTVQDKKINLVQIAPQSSKNLETVRPPQSFDIVFPNGLQIKFHS